MKKICFILASLNVGGVEKNTLRLIKKLLDKGYQVDLLVVRNEGVYREQLDKRTNIIYLNNKKISHSIIKISNYLKENRPDAFISAKDYINIIVILANVLSGTKTKTIISTRTQVSIELNTQKRFNRIINKLLMKITYPFATHLVAVSKGVANDLASIIGVDSNTINVIYNPIVDEEIKKRKKLHVDIENKNDNEAMLVCAGRLTTQKDYPTLLNAMEIVKIYKNVKLIILGEGDQRKKIEDMIHKLNLEDFVYLKGNVTNPYPYMRAADLFVLSSKWEGFGNVIVESLAVGTPIVSTDCPSGPNEILNNGEYGILVPVGNAKLLAKGIIEALDKTWDKEALINRANEFSVERATNSYITLIES
ncbi:glycosyltransferase [Sedimentibacter hydroxybenzoicus DSM 7310]|uniref:Glycosyltransferase n=1 Tax=Sedimentibacter hydroxybenzoicus DSM 7310 TaxID=1123245 RepID=A0A974BJV0_SEDHY|nr:glycosyltransferase [Sedimentibacter hydroxybenzoicus]NYB74508.1 glycosyltransferase [Sedimentibacter hydroxybenzoicus DSM 7310]